ncbi:3-oxoacyl-ACP synthase [Streptomyces sp. PKU-MA01144]|uniref:beta-ketoacyl synthase N-terminal-like domain-containing protein n=1 Tax=Streptomyces sp. PKU-MA01144 TaxID=2729138 RepID=UPI00147C9A30|nr:beta-ketoacyl synthase N-terminal-like domain-containing protein [Streptomyces sp. PKU-MA01144]NNJ05535.1 3-oxoacyl-ACP synthase [Streptomyces sp. PKU-MA01144]
MTPRVITAWSAVSPFGIGREAFAAGVASGASAVTRLEEWPVPRQRVAPVPGFEVEKVLGRKGTRSMDRVSALAAAAAGELLGTNGRHREVAAGERAALVLGTTAGSSKSMMDITRDTHTRAMPFHIDTPRIPNAIMNSSAAQCAIRHDLKGPNTTVAGGRAAGLFALRYALRLLHRGRARSVLCGGAEELTPERGWLAHRAGGPDRPTALGEGCSLLLLEPAASQDRPVLAEVLGVTVGVFRDGERETGLVSCLSRALERAGVTAADLWAVSPAVGQDEVRLEPHAALTLPQEEAWGDAGAAAAPFQIASVLAAAEQDPAARGRIAAVLSADPDNVLGCALFRIANEPGSAHV